MKASASAAKKCDLCTGDIKNSEDTLQCSELCSPILCRSNCQALPRAHWQFHPILLSSLYPTVTLSEDKRPPNGNKFTEKGARGCAIVAKPHLEEGGGDSVSGSLSKPSASFQPKDPLASKRSYANALSSSLQNKVSNPDRKFCVVVYGLNENPKGTPKHCRISNDVKSASELIQPLCPELTEQSIRD